MCKASAACQRPQMSVDYSSSYDKLGLPLALLAALLILGLLLAYKKKKLCFADNSRCLPTSEPRGVPERTYICEVCEAGMVGRQVPRVPPSPCRKPSPPPIYSQ